MQQESLTLLQLHRQIKKAITERFPDNYWVVAEISSLNVNRTGHCYLELVEKGDEDNIIAKCRGIVWSYTFRMLKPYFETSTGQELTSGIKVMINVSVTFHELYGYSLNIKDIDPSYTLGDIARKKMEIIKRLEDEGVIDMNKQLEERLVYQRLAVISSETAAGYGDFMDQITYNSFGYKFHTTLFQAAMQGDKTEKSIIQCLEQIHEQEKYFDAVVIIRGGGAQSDLHAFNKYWLAFHVAQFPLPVITGIGHERDETVIDMVAHTRLKTPTAVADFLIGKMLQFHEYLDNSQHKVLNFAKAFLDDENFMLSNLTHQLKESTFRSLSADKYDLNLKAKKLSIHTKNLLKSAHIRLDYNISHVDSQFKKLLESKHQDLNIIPDKLKKTQKQFLQQQMQKMVLLSNTAKYLDPQTILKRGFSITEKDGKLVRSSDNLNEHDKVVTHLHDGFFTSTVNKIQSK